MAMLVTVISARSKEASASKVPIGPADPNTSYSPGSRSRTWLPGTEKPSTVSDSSAVLNVDNVPNAANAAPTMNTRIESQSDGPFFFVFAVGAGVVMASRGIEANVAQVTLAQATHRPRLPLWAVVLAGGVITALSLGVRSTFGLLVGPISDGLGADLGSISLAVAIQNLVWGFSQPLAGAISDRFGAPRTLAAGGVLYIAAMALMSTAESTGVIILTGGFLAGIAVGAASFAVVLSAVGRVAPAEKRSLMLGITSAIGSLGQFILIPIARLLLDRGDWQSASLALALILIPIIVFAPAMSSKLIALSNAAEANATSMSPSAPSLSDDLKRARSSRSYLLLNAAFFVCGFHVTFIGVHLAGFVNLQGLSPSTASTGLALIGLFNVFGSLLVGVLGQRFSYTKLLAGIYAMRAVVISIFVLMPITPTSTIIFAMAMGVLWLSTVPPTSGIVTEMFGPTNSGALFGIVFLSHQLGAFIGAWMGGEVVDLTGSYAIMWWLAVALGIAATAAHLLLKEGPAPKPPQDFRPGLAPTAMVVLVMAAGIAAALSLSSTPASASTTSVLDTSTGHAVDNSPPAFYCALGPIVTPR